MAEGGGETNPGWSETPTPGTHNNDLPMVYEPQLSLVTMDTQSTGTRRGKAGGKKSSLKTLKRSMTKGLADFFLGDLKQDEPTTTLSRDPQDKWKNRSRLLHSNSIVGGKIKPTVSSYDTTDSVFDSASTAGSTRTGGGGGGGQIVDPLARGHAPATARQDSHVSRTSRLSKSFHYPSRQWSHVSTASSSKRSIRPIPRRVSRKDSVVQMAYDGLRDLVAGSRRPSKRKPVMHSRSFSPACVSDFDDTDTLKGAMHEIDVRARMAPRSTEAQSHEAQGPEAAEANSVEANPEETPAKEAQTPEAKPLMQKAKQKLWRTKSPAVDSVFTSEDSVLDDVFFNTPTPTGTLMSPFALARGQQTGEPVYPLPTITERSSGTSRASSDGYRARDVPVGGPQDTLSDEIEVPVVVEDPGLPAKEMRPTKSGWRVGIPQPIPKVTTTAQGPDTPDLLGEDSADGPFETMARIKTTLIDATLDNSDRREIGKGFMGNILDLSYRKDRLTSEIEAQIEAIDEHRPYFTYWVTFVQVVIYIISVSVYGIAPVGFEETRKSGEVRMPNLAIQLESRVEKDNLWIGPRQADLIHLGAKYSPCMRKDRNVEDAILEDKFIESQTACCIRNDGSGCLQTAEKDCSSSLSKWYTWRDYPMYSDGRTSGPVCGTDPRKCKNPLSQGAFQWADDITQWPVCLEAANVSETDEFKHMTCKISGRPCCIGIQGECTITTREHCEFLEGFFHEEAFLCSQVSCMNEICGMMPFLDSDVPDQFYRLWTSLFLHAGLLQLIVSVLFQFFIMRDMEKLAGWLRISIIYIGSGIAGSLSSAIFLPYHVEAGPAGCQFGMLSMLFVEVIQNFYIIKHPWRALGKLIGILLFLFVLGLLPYIDNYAHLVGFVFGFLLAFALLPYITFNKLDRRGKIIGIVVCLITATGLFALLIVLFYVTPVYNCPNCHYFNCIPFTPKFCETMEVKIRRTL